MILCTQPTAWRPHVIAARHYYWLCQRAEVGGGEGGGAAVRAAYLCGEGDSRGLFRGASRVRHLTYGPCRQLQERRGTSGGITGRTRLQNGLQHAPRSAWAGSRQSSKVATCIAISPHAEVGVPGLVSGRGLAVALGVVPPISAPLF